jgi:hypothetical protein
MNLDICEISSSHGGEYEVQICLQGLMMEAALTSETSADNYFTRQYIPEDKSELHNWIYVIMPLQTIIFSYCQNY